MSTDDPTPLPQSSSLTPNTSSTQGAESSAFTRRDFLHSAGALTAMAGIQTLLPGWAQAAGSAAQGGLTAL